MARRTTFGATLLTVFFILTATFAIFLYAYAPAAPNVRGPILLSAFLIILVASLLCILLFLRWMLRPYRQLVGEAQRAPVAAHANKSQDEAQFVLETFQTIVAQLQKQQKELELLSAQASQRADSAEKFSERIVASVPSALIAFDGKGRSLLINGPGHALLELSGEETGQPVRELLGSMPQLAELVESCLQTGALFRREEIQTLSASGTTRRMGATVAPIDLSSERGALCLLTDITEVTQLREQVALKRNLESLGEMSAGLAHEFKNAIATLHGYVQLLQNLELNAAGRSATDSLLNEVRNLSEMVTSFLNFARPQPLQLEAVSLAELLEDCALELKPLYERQRVTLSVRPAANQAEQIVIDADERMLRQALLNLLRNAAEAIPEDATERQVVVACSTERNAGDKPSVVLEIKDTGTGIPPADLPRIFFPFFTSKAKGHGIGLALAYRVVTDHGGTLAAGNAKAGGAVFTIRLPMSVKS